MELKEVLAITGKSGLYKFVAKSRHGFVVEPLGGGTRFAVSIMNKVSSLADIAMFMHDKDLPLAKVFTAMLPHEAAITALDLNDSKRVHEARELYAKILPDYNENKVRDRDIVRAFKWFLILITHGVREFETAEPEKEPTATTTTAAPEEA